ncbi:unnamed protein product [Parajaminaea phylloscopi]
MAREIQFSPQAKRQAAKRATAASHLKSSQSGADLEEKKEPVATDREERARSDPIKTIAENTSAMPLEKWAISANRALSLRLAGAPSPVDKPFGPEFTYQVGFGQEETVFGYMDLSILLTFTASALLPLLSINFSKVNESTTAKIDDIPAILAEYLPEDVLTDPTLHAEKLEEEADTFTPLGTKVAEYVRTPAAAKGKGKRNAPGSVPSSNGASGSKSPDGPGTQHFEIYSTTWQTPGWREFHRRMQVFALLYIEGASYIHEDEDNWEWLTTWQRWTDDKGRQRWAFVGYTRHLSPPSPSPSSLPSRSLYRFWHYPSSSRLRLSQFVILPPYHKQSHGSRLYAQCYARVLADEAVTELTVEDPNEAFDRLRDTADLKELLRPEGIIEQMSQESRNDGSTGVILDAPLSRVASEVWRKRAKMAKRQWSRLVEMVQLMYLNPDDQEGIKDYRLQVKARLYRFNRDVLTQLPIEERREKLHLTYQGLLQQEYGDLVGVDVTPFLPGPDGVMLEVDGDDDGEEEEEEEEEIGGSVKRQRL